MAVLVVAEAAARVPTLDGPGRLDVCSEVASRTRCPRARCRAVRQPAGSAPGGYRRQLLLRASPPERVAPLQRVPSAPAMCRR
eukprot:365819-Chlamydomonas_euryale.AAC.14